MEDSQTPNNGRNGYGETGRGKEDRNDVGEEGHEEKKMVEGKTPGQLTEERGRIVQIFI